MAKRVLASLVIFCMSFEQCFAQVASSVSLPAAFSAVSAQERFRPPQLRSMVYDHSRKSLDLLLDQGDARDLDVKQATGALMEYFQTALALPDAAFWVNLRPDSQDRIIDPALEKTAFGKALLEADVTLKKDLARATSPLTAEGRKYWTKLYAKAETIFGSGAATIPTISRPWIVPGEIIIRQDAQSVYVYKATLKVQLEQDYLKDSRTYNLSDPRLKELNEYAGGLIRELILPALTKRVNSARGYASLRQAYYSLILAQWYKKHFRGTQAEYAGRIDSGDLTGLNSGTWSKEEYFNAYRTSFSDGEYNVNESIATSNGTTVRRYASGGAVLKLSQATVFEVAPGSRLMNSARPAGTQLLDGGTFTPRGGDGEADINGLKGAPLARGVTGVGGVVSGRLFVFDEGRIIEANVQEMKRLKKETGQPVILYVAAPDQTYMSVLDLADGLITEGVEDMSFSVSLAGVFKIPAVVGAGRLFVGDRPVRTGDAVVVDGAEHKVYAAKTIPAVSSEAGPGYESSVTRRDGGQYQQLFADAADGKNANRVNAYAQLKEVALGKKGEPALKELVAMFESQVPAAVKTISENLFGRQFGYDVRGLVMAAANGIVDLTPMDAYLIGKALGTRYAQEGDRSLITGDQRWHTPALRLAMALGMYSVGVDVEISDEVFGTGEHGLLSGENRFLDKDSGLVRRYKMMTQVSGSHNPPENNGLKIKADAGNGKLEPVYAADLSDLYDKVIKTNSFRPFNPAHPIKESQPLIDMVVDAYDQTLPAVNPEQPIVFDCRNSALVDALKKLVARRGLKNVRWMNDVADPSMPGGIWDPSKPEALVPCSGAVKEWNKQLETQKSPLRAVGFVFDGDGDRCTAILEDGVAVPAFEMTLPFYQRFISDPVNQRVVKRLKEFSDGKIQLACDIRATSTLLKMIDRYPDYAGYYIQPGYPAQRDFVSWRISELKELVNMNRPLRTDTQFMKDFQHFCETYFTAEASGHQFFHICPTNKEVVIDAGIAVAFNLLHIKETIGQVEVNDPALGFSRTEKYAEKGLGWAARALGRNSVYKYSLTDLFAKFPKAIASDDVNIVVPNVIKAELEQVMVRKLQEKYAGQLAVQSPLSIVGKMRIQPKQAGAVLSEGVKVQLKDGTSSALFRKSNTSPKATLMFEGATPQKLVELMTDMEGVIKDGLKEFAQSGDPQKAEAAAKVDLKDLTVKTLAVKAKYNLDGGINPEGLMVEIDYVMRSLGIQDYPRIIETMRRSTDPVAFVDTLAGISGKDAAAVVAVLMDIPYFAPIAADYRVLTAESFDAAEFALKEVAVGVRAQGYDVAGTQKQNAGQPISDRLAVMRREVGNVPFVFRDGMLDFVGRFLGRRPATLVDPDLLDLINRAEKFFKTVDMKNIRYVVTSGIGANEMYSHQLAQILNAYFEDQGIHVKWIVVNNPSHLNRIPGPADAVPATDANTMVFEMSRSGTTKETVDFFAATKDMFRTRIVAANSGPLKEGALALKAAGGNVLVIDDTPGDIGGRQMNRKTLMVYLPLFAALSAGFKDSSRARNMLERYVSASLVANSELAYSSPDSAAVSMAEFLYRHRADRRNKFSVVFDDSLKYSAKELFQLLNEGANKNIAGGSNNNILASYSFQQDEANYKKVFDSAAQSQLPLFLLNKNSAHYSSALAYVAELRRKGIPAIVINVDLGNDLNRNLEVLARTSALLQDMVVYFTYITSQDANSNPAVKMVREITTAIFDILKLRRQAGNKDIRLNSADVIAAMRKQQADDLKKAKAAMTAKSVVKTAADPRFAKFEQALSELAKGLGMTDIAVTETMLGAVSAEVAKADVGEAGGSKNAAIKVAFDDSAMTTTGILGALSPDRALPELDDQIVLQDSKGYKVSIAVAKGAGFDRAGTLKQQLARYFYGMYKERKATFEQLALTYMESDADNPKIKDISTELTSLFAEFNVTIPMLALPGVAHTGIEAVMSHPENVFNIAIVYTNAYGEGLGTREVEPGVTIDDSNYIYSISNMIRGGLAGIPTIIFELENKNQLGQAKVDIEEGMALFRDQMSLEEDGGRKAVLETGKEAKKDGGLGGIALGALPITDMTRVPVAQVAAGSALTLSQLDSQWRTIRLDMTTGGIPFLKIKEYLSACAGRKDAGKQLKNVTTCVSNILKKDEEEAVATSPELKELLGLLG